MILDFGLQILDFNVATNKSEILILKSKIKF